MIPPAWAAGTVYGAWARVTGGSRVWMTVAGGTAGGAEPAWPVLPPWSVADNTVTWILASAARQQFVAGLLDVLTDFRNANPTMLKGVRAARPKSMTNFDLPGAYVGSRDEALAHDAQTRTRRFTPSVVVVDVVPDNTEAQDRMDALIDGLVDLFTANPHAASGSSVIVVTQVAEVPLEEGGIQYLANELLLGETQVQEGRAF